VPVLIAIEQYGRKGARGQRKRRGEDKEVVRGALLHCIIFAVALKPKTVCDCS